MDLWILAGRAAAYAVHPVAAWQQLSPGGRAVLVSSYAGWSYASVLAALLA